MATVPCLCPAKASGEVRHPDGDTITLREKLDFRGALTARNTLLLMKQEDPSATSAELWAGITETLVLVGVESWSLVDVKGKPVEVTKASIRDLLLSHMDAGITVATEADDRYWESTIAPLVTGVPNSSPSTSTDESTSATTGSESTPPKQSKRSSTTTSPTGGTARTSPSLAGVSN